MVRGRDLCRPYHVLTIECIFCYILLLLLLDQDYLMLYQFTFAKFQFYHFIRCVNCECICIASNTNNLEVMKLTIVCTCSTLTHLSLPFHCRIYLFDDIVLVLLSRSLLFPSICKPNCIRLIASLKICWWMCFKEL